MSQRGGYYVSADHLENQVRGASPEVFGSRKLPQIRICRATNLDDVSSRRIWDHYLNYMGDATRMTGTVRSFGQLAITYCSAQEMGRRLANKFDCFGARNFKKSLGVVRSVACDYNKFVRESAAETIQLQNFNLEEANTGGDTSNLWLPSSCQVLDRYQTLDNERVLSLGLSPKSERSIEKEIAMTEQFLRGIGLGRGKAAPQVPHLSIVKLFDPLGTVEIKNVPDIPTDYGISLLSPHAYVAENRPPKA